MCWQQLSIFSVHIQQWHSNIIILFVGFYFWTLLKGHTNNDNYKYIASTLVLTQVHSTTVTTVAVMDRAIWWTTKTDSQSKSICAVLIISSQPLLCKLTTHFNHLLLHVFKLFPEHFLFFIFPLWRDYLYNALKHQFIREVYQAWASAVAGKAKKSASRRALGSSGFSCQET